jgi:hypothetical protein
MGPNNFKNAYILNKFFYGDKGVEDQLFFIPPIHPYLQLFAVGESWHARSKIYAGSWVQHGFFKIDKFGGITFPGNIIPDFLRSEYNREQMFERFKLFIAQHRAQLQDKQEEEHVETDLFGGRKMRRIRKKTKRKQKRRKRTHRKTRK